MSEVGWGEVRVCSFSPISIPFLCLPSPLCEGHLVQFETNTGLLSLPHFLFSTQQPPVPHSVQLEPDTSRQPLFAW